MDITSLTGLVISKFKEAGGYSELDDKALYKSIHNYLESQYRRHFYLAQKRLSDDEKCGIFPDKAKYDAAYVEVENIVVTYANKLAAVEKIEV